MATIVGKTIHSTKPYSFSIEPWMFTKTLSHLFFEKQLEKQLAVKNGQNGVAVDTDADVLLVNARNPTDDILKTPDLEILSRLFFIFNLKSIQRCAVVMESILSYFGQLLREISCNYLRYYRASFAAVNYDPQIMATVASSQKTQC